jgi:hypothetical protein
MRWRVAPEKLRAHCMLCSEAAHKLKEMGRLRLVACELIGGGRRLIGQQREDAGVRGFHRIEWSSVTRSSHHV